MDDYFAHLSPDPTISEWMTVMDIQQKYCMTKTAVYSFVSHNAIPRKMEGNNVLYSKRHVYFPEKGCHLGTNRSDNET